MSSVLFYDPPGRVVGTLHPNRSWEKTVFDAWKQTTWDVNDTVLIPRPDADTDLGSFFSQLPDFEYLPTWYGERIGGGLGEAEQNAARQAAVCDKTPA